jgi:hypothetical protein
MIDTDNPLTLKCEIARLERERNEFSDASAAFYKDVLQMKSDMHIRKSAWESALKQLSDERDVMRALLLEVLECQSGADIDDMSPRIYAAVDRGLPQEPAQDSGVPLRVELAAIRTELQRIGDLLLRAGKCAGSE